MRKILLALIICLLPVCGWGAISATTVWEIRPDATAANVNGCGFNPSNATPGTDYSQQNAAEDSGTDLASADGDAAGCVITSASHNFVDADEGNLIHITETGTGFTVGWYEIVSTSANAATLDRACGADGALTGGDWYMGGACSLEDASDSDLLTAIIAGNTVYILSNTGATDTDYDLAEAITFTNGADAAPVTIVGYVTGTRTTTAVLSQANMPLIEAGGYTINTGTGNILKNVNFNGGVNNLLTIASPTVVSNIKVINTEGHVAVFLSGILTNSDIQGAAGETGVYINGQSILNCYVHNTGTCITISGRSNIGNNIIDTCSITGIGVAATTARDTISIIGNTLFGADSATADGIDMGSNNQGWLIMNNIIANWNVGITNVNAGLIEDYNLFYSNDTDGNLGINDVTGSDPWVGTPADGDFRVNTAAKAKGYPNGIAMPGTNALNLGYTDIGAVQRAEPTATGGAASAW